MFLIVLLVCITTGDASRDYIQGAGAELKFAGQRNKSCDWILSERIFNNKRLLIKPSNHIKANMTWAITGVEEIDEVSEHAKVFLFMVISWQDERLSWTAEECSYSRIKVYPVTRIWFPLFILINAFERVADYSRFNDRFAYIHHDAKNEFIYYGEEEMKCEMRMFNYPNDEHTCLITMYFADEVYVTPTDVTGSPGIPVDDNPEWTLTGTSFEVNAERHMVQLKYTVKRKPTFIVVAVIIPAMILCPLPVLPFVLPPASGEKMGVALETLLTFFITGLSFFDSIPVSGDVPLMGIWFIYLMFTTALSCIMSAFVIRLAEHENISDKHFSLLVMLARFAKRKDITAKTLNAFSFILFTVLNLIIPYFVILGILLS